jgi:putative hydrolase of the HAD superfamily
MLISIGISLTPSACHNAAMTKIDRTPTKADFAHVSEWVFDLDNTLYPHHINLFAQIDKNMTSYVSALLQMERDEARKLQKQYYYDHGTTLQGLMIHHGVDPNDFLEKAHAIDYSALLPQPELGEAIKTLPGRKFIFTNGSVKHAEMAAGALGILEHFDDIFDIVAADFVPKPAQVTYDKFTALKRVETSKAAMFEDLPRNLVVPKALAMSTVLLVPNNLEDIDFVTDDLTAFLAKITG